MWRATLVEDLALVFLARLALAVGVEPHEVFATNLRALRLEAGLSQDELSKRCGLHITEISRLERARREPRLSTIVRLAVAIGVPAGSLVEGLGRDAEDDR